MAPSATERTALEEDGGTDPGAVIHAEMLDVEDASRDGCVECLHGFLLIQPACGQ